MKGAIVTPLLALYPTYTHKTKLASMSLSVSVPALLFSLFAAAALLPAGSPSQFRERLCRPVEEQSILDFDD